MPVPSLVTDLSTTAASNSPAGSDNVFPDLDNYLRAMSAFIASIRDNSGNGWVSPYLPLAGGTVTGATTFSNTVTGTKFIPTGTSATGNGMYLPATNTLGFSTNGAEVARLDSSGNLGLGVTPSAWGSTWRALEGSFGQSWFYSNTVTTTGLVSNASHNGTNWIYKTTNAALRYELGTSADHRWYTAPSGTAGNAITFTQAMTLDASGNLGVGVTGPAVYTVGSRLLQIDGGANATELKLTNNTTGNAGGDGTLLQLNGLAAYFWNLENSFLSFGTNNTERARITSAGDFIHQVNGTAPTLSTNSTMSFELTSNTSLKIVVRGTDGVTRSATLTLA